MTKIQKKKKLKKKKKTHMKLLSRVHIDMLVNTKCI
jgi:hypothetical protein